MNTTSTLEFVAPLGILVGVSGLALLSFCLLLLFGFFWDVLSLSPLYSSVGVLMSLSSACSLTFWSLHLSAFPSRGIQVAFPVISTLTELLALWAMFLICVVWTDALLTGGDNLRAKKVTFYSFLCILILVSTFALFDAVWNGLAAVQVVSAYSTFLALPVISACEFLVTITATVLAFVTMLKTPKQQDQRARGARIFLLGAALLFLAALLRALFLVVFQLQGSPALYFSLIIASQMIVFTVMWAAVFACFFRLKFPLHPSSSANKPLLTQDTNDDDTL